MNYKIPGTLQIEELEYFNRVGYIVLPKAYTQELVTEIYQLLLKDARARRPPYRLSDDGEVTHLDNVFDRYAEVRSLVRNEILTGPLRSLLGNNVLMTRNRHNHATLNFRGAQQAPRLHRDILHSSRSIVTAVVYLVDSTIDNGCTYIVPGSHCLPQIGEPNNGGTWMDENSVYARLSAQELPVPLPGGSVLLFSGLLFHRVSANTTGSPRPSMTFGFHSVDELCSDVSDGDNCVISGNRIYRGNDIIYREDRIRR